MSSKFLVRTAILAAIMALGGCVAYPAPVAYGPGPGYYYPQGAYGTVDLGYGRGYHHW